MEVFTKSFLQQLSNAQTIQRKKAEEDFQKSLKDIVELAKKGQSYAFVIGIFGVQGFLRENKLADAITNFETNILPLYKKQFPDTNLCIIDLPTLIWSTGEHVPELKLQKQLYEMKNNTLTTLHKYVDYDSKHTTRYIFINWT